jgi:hypothetical protein
MQKYAVLPESAADRTIISRRWHGAPSAIPGLGKNNAIALFQRGIFRRALVKFLEFEGF